MASVSTHSEKGGSCANYCENRKCLSERSSLKAAYFMVFASLATFTPYVSLLLKSRGLSSADIGIILAIPPLTQLVAAPLWSAFADRLALTTTVAKRLTLTSSGFLALLARQSLLVSGSTAWSCALAVLAYESCGAYLQCGLDSMTMAYLAHTPQAGGTGMYGRQRMFGSIGWGLAAFAAGPLFDRFGLQTMFPLHAALLLPTLVLFLVLPERAPIPVVRATGVTEEDGTISHAVEVEGHKPLTAGGINGRVVASEAWKGPSSPHNGQTIAHAPQGASHGQQPVQLLTLNFLAFALVATISGLLYGVISSFQFVYFQSLGATGLQLGLVVATSCLSELPTFTLSGWIVDRIGLYGCLLATFTCYTIRLLYYSFLTNPWAALPAELLQGTTFALGWAASVRYTAESAPPGYESIAQGTLAALQWGLGIGTGSLVGGAIYDVHGPRVLFAAAAGLAGLTATALAALLAVQYCTGQQPKGVLLETVQTSPMSAEQELVPVRDLQPAAASPKGSDAGGVQVVLSGQTAGDCTGQGESTAVQAHAVAFPLPGTHWTQGQSPMSFVGRVQATGSSSGSGTAHHRRNPSHFQ